MLFFPVPPPRVIASPPSAAYDAATCYAFASWQAGRSGFRPVLRLSDGADNYIKFDVAQLAGHDTKLNACYVHLDCTLPAD